MSQEDSGTAAASPAGLPVHEVANSSRSPQCATGAIPGSLPGGLFWALYGLFDSLYAAHHTEGDVLAGDELYALCLHAVSPWVHLEERSWRAYQLRRAVTTAYKRAGYRRYAGRYDVAGLLTVTDDL